MESLLAATMSYRFGYRFLQQDLLTDPQWETVRDILERYFGMKDVTTALRYAAERVHDGLQRNPGVPGHARFRQDLDSMLCAGENDYRKGTGGGVAGDGKVGVCVHLDVDGFVTISEQSWRSFWTVWSVAE